MSELTSPDFLRIDDSHPVCVSVNDMRLLKEAMTRWTSVSLDESKVYLVQNRLRRLFDETACRSVDELLALCRSQRGTSVRESLIDALTTHETYFFREREAIDWVAEHVVAEIRQRMSAAASVTAPRMTVWCVGCSTGQEPISLAIRLWQAIDDIERWKIRILATDVSRGSIARAEAGWYDPIEVRRGLDENAIGSFFQATKDAGRTAYRVVPAIRRMIQYQCHNATEPIGNGFRSDLIICRNMLIYFDPATRERLFANFARHANDHGWMMLGRSDCYRGGAAWTRRRPGRVTVYRRTADRP